MNISKIGLSGCASILAFMAHPVVAQDSALLAADDQGAEAAVGDIIVTAQKRAQSINDVGMAIQAAAGDTLVQRGIADTKDLVKIVPGFSATNSGYSTPVITLRGIGLYDSALMSSPSVSVYVDQIPRNYPYMSGGVGLDVERVEVLKGPQGTLFGQSSTGGAINYIPAKPTDHFEAGLDTSYERFGKAELSGFVSGPLADTLKARLAVRAVQGGAWQRSVSRPQDENGKTDTINARLLVDWQPIDRLKFEFGLTGLRDKSDNIAPQFIRTPFNFYLSDAALAASGNPYGVVDPAGWNALNDPASPAFDPSFAARQALVVSRLTDASQGAASIRGANLLLGQQAIPDNNRLAEWNPDWPNSNDNSYWQATLRADYDLTNNITLTSLSAFARQKVDSYFDQDGTLAAHQQVHLFGTIKTFNQELRIAGKAGRVNWIIGASYDYGKSDDNNQFDLSDNGINEVLPGLRFNGVASAMYLKQKANTYAAFGNIEYRLTDNFTVLGGIRYTKNNRSAENCGYDASPEQNLSKTFGNADSIPGFGFYDLQTALGVPASAHKVVQPGQCIALGADFTPIIEPFRQKLNQDNLSWRAGLNYKLDQGTLLYATVSQGYKSGIFAAIQPATTSQWEPAVQEKVVAYEAGFKAPLFGRRLQLNGSGFYYDYSDKQVRARVLDPIFGLLERLLNVPKSYIWGIEGEILARPVDGLTLSASGTYLKSRVTSSFATAANGAPVYNQAGYTGDFKGATLPFTPKFSATFDGQYEWEMGSGLRPFVGGSLVYHGKNNATFETDILNADDFEFPAYTTVDLRAGIGSDDDKWRLTVFGRNVFNKYYNTTIFSGIDTLYRFPGNPATYGVAVRFRFN